MNNFVMRADEILQDCDIAKEFLVKTGLPLIDRNIEWVGGSFHVLASVSGVGKTSLACQIATKTNEQTGNAVVFCTLEMPPNQILRKMSKNCNLKDRDIFIIHSNDLEEIINGINEVHSRLPEGNKIGLVIIDHLGCIHTENDNNTNANCAKRNSDIMQSFKKKAQDLDCVFLFLSQLDFKTTKKNASPSSMSYSSEFYRYADSCLHLVVEEEANVNRLLIFIKNRYELTEVMVSAYVKLNFDFQKNIFTEIASHSFSLD